MRVKICDFGLSTVKPQRHQMLKDQTTAKGTPLFMAPEVYFGRRGEGRKGKDRREKGKGEEERKGTRHTY